MAKQTEEERERDLERQREREQRTPAVDESDQDDFDNAFGSAAAGEEPPEDEFAQVDDDEESGSRAGDTDQSGSDGSDESDDSAAAAGGEDADGSGEAAASGDESGDSAEQEESWDQVGRELGALFERDESNITPARVKHHVKTWHGRYKSERDKRVQAETELEKLRAGASDSQAPSSGEDGSQRSDAASSDSMDELRRRFSDEFGEELPQLVEQIADARAREIAQEQAKQAVQPFQERQQQEDQQEHHRRVTEMHPDADALAESDDLWQWIDSQPAAFRDAYNRIAEQGSADDVNRMLSDYKTARGMGGGSDTDSQSGHDASAGQGGGDQGGQGDDAPATRRREAPRRPPSRSPSGPRRGDADPNDFDAAFDQALGS